MRKDYKERVRKMRVKEDENLSVGKKEKKIRRGTDRLRQMRMRENAKDEKEQY